MSPKQDIKLHDGSAEAPKEEVKVSGAFIDTLEDAVRVYVDKWQERDEGGNLAQRHDVELLKDELRPLVFEGVRQQVDDDMRIVLQNLKVSLLLTSPVLLGKT